MLQSASQLRPEDLAARLAKKSVQEIAADVGVSKQAVYNKLKKLGMKVARGREGREVTGQNPGVALGHYGQ